MREPGGRRRVAEICVLDREPPGLVTMVPALAFWPAGELRWGPGERRLRSLFDRAGVVAA